MKPLVLKLSNFGPFLKEEIDFTQIEDNELFLISGKTGSGKTMIFDAIMFALYGEASTKDRKDSDLRSHFADGQSPMTVTYEFEINQRVFKVHREGPFIKEGNTTRTNAKLDVYELVDDKYELRESKVTPGTLFITEILGVNANQFRQLFILPQGEFKRFLFSNSKDKQTILRTLFNSQRFETIQNILIEDVKEEKAQLEKRYQQIDLLWDDIDAFDNHQLIEAKAINSQQTQLILNKIPLFKQTAQQLLSEKSQEKETAKYKLEKSTKLLDENIELKSNLESLAQYQNHLTQLDNKQIHIKEQQSLLQKLNEIRPLANMLDNKQITENKLKDIRDKQLENEKLLDSLNDELKLYQGHLSRLENVKDDIDKKKDYIQATLTFYSNISKYRHSDKEIVALKERISKLEKKMKTTKEEQKQINDNIKDKHKNYEIIDTFNSDIFQLNQHIKDLEQNNKNKTQIAELTDKLKSHEEELDNWKTQKESLELELQNIDTTSIDLNNKEDFINEIKTAVHVGEVCPICGNEIHSLDDHIDFKSINQRQEKIKQLDSKLVKAREQMISLQTKIDNFNEQINSIEIKSLEYNDLNYLNEEIERKKQKIKSQKEQNNYIEQQQQQLTKVTEEIHVQEMEVEKFNSELKQHMININDFERTTQYENIDEFVDYFVSIQEKVEKYTQRLTETNQKITEITQQFSIQQNNKHHYEQQLSNYIEELSQIKNNITQELSRLKLNSTDEVAELTSQLSKKEEIEKEIDDYKAQYHKTEAEVSRLRTLTQDRQLDDIEMLQQQVKEQELLLQRLNEEYSTLKYQVKINEEKLDEISKHISVLSKELQSQQQIFQLSEIISGKNNKKLTLENYVLIYYLDQIIAQANLHLAKMSGNRYQLQRRQAISQGFSGLEIDIFDLHSNKSRHISTLSGGETFQSSLALALGLSEVVQQQSGGISLESIFIDEGFGTLDQETLETALDTLINLKTSGRMVGIISHVSELKNRIPLILEVKSNQFQSTTSFKRN